MLSTKILDFYRHLKIAVPLPEGIEYMNPYQDAKAFALCSAFYNKFYHDTRPRKIILGINPGRFGGGITGIPFTDPIKLETICSIPNDFVKKPELSADFIYSVIQAYGGPAKFYGDYYISALSPLGFLREGKNLNYYDDRDLKDSVEPFMVHCLEKQLEFGIERRIGFCLGEGENYTYLLQLNSRYHFFDSIEPLPHPRFIMQYRRKKIDEYLRLYLEELGGSYPVTATT